MTNWALENEEGVMVYKLLAAVKVHECSHVYAVVVVDYLFKSATSNNP
jgi:hypothetical protein